MEINKRTPKCWKPLLDVARRWLSESDPTTNEEMKAAAFACLDDFICHLVPLHLTYILLGNVDPSSSQNDWWKGQDKNGRLTEGILKAHLEWMVDRDPLYKSEVFYILSGANQFPALSREKLEALFDKHYSNSMPRAFRHMFGRDKEAQKELSDKLNAELGRYREVNFHCLLSPLTLGGKQPRPKKRKRMGKTDVFIPFT